MFEAAPVERIPPAGAPAHRRGIDRSDCGAVKLPSPRATLVVAPDSATPAEAAAIVAALVRFAGARAAAAHPVPAGGAVDPWWRAAVLEGVGCEELADDDDPIGAWAGRSPAGWINA